ncbi:hypothetical protein C2L66_13895 [Paraburkholderia caribensis]|nr:hypothetical protein C2L66_13895 [Paraburkholderia caribensis]
MPAKAKARARATQQMPQPQQNPSSKTNQNQNQKTKNPATSHPATGSTLIEQQPPLNQPTHSRASLLTDGCPSGTAMLQPGSEPSSP